VDLGQDVIATINLLPEPMMIASVEGRILGANAALSRQLGMPQQSLIDREMREIALDTPGEISDYLRRCARSGQLLLGSLTFRRV
jgi:hypothetical protein